MHYSLVCNSQTAAQDRALWIHDIVGLSKNTYHSMTNPPDPGSSKKRRRRRPDRYKLNAKAGPELFSFMTEALSTASAALLSSFSHSRRSPPQSQMISIIIAMQFVWSVICSCDQTSHNLKFYQTKINPIVLVTSIHIPFHILYNCSHVQKLIGRSNVTSVHSAANHWCNSSSSLSLPL